MGNNPRPLVLATHNKVPYSADVCSPGDSLGATLRFPFTLNQARVVNVFISISISPALVVEELARELQQTV